MIIEQNIIRHKFKVSLRKKELRKLFESAGRLETYLSKLIELQFLLADIELLFTKPLGEHPADLKELSKKE